MEVLFNLDENSNFIKRATFTQDFREVHSKCWVLFTLPADLDFIEGFGFIFRGQEWEAVSYKKVSTGSGDFLSVLGYPRAVCSYITKEYLNLSSLATGVGTKLVSGSKDLEFEFPLHSILFGSLMYKYRYGSIEKNRDDPINSWFIFYDSRGLFGSSYEDLLKGRVLDYNMDACNALGGSSSFIRDYLMVRYQKDSHPSRVHYKNWVGSLVGDKFDINSAVSGVIGARYKLSGKGEDVYSGYKRLLLVRQKFDSTKQPLPWTLTFGNLAVGG